MNVRVWSLVIAVLVLVPERVGARDIGSLQGSNLLIFEVGRNPRSTLEEDGRNRLFNQFILDYRIKSLAAGLRVDVFHDSANAEMAVGPGGDDYEYDEITQRYLEWSDLTNTVRLGNGYAILGRGLLFRAFELPGVVRQTLIPTIGYAENRDLDGVTAQHSSEWLEATVFHGEPTILPDAPPGLPPDRRSGEASGGRLAARPWPGVWVAGSYLRLEETSELTEGKRGAVDVALQVSRFVPLLVEHDVDVSLYGEYAADAWNPWQDGFNTNTGTPHALYSSAEVSYPGGGFSFETKDYHQFDLRVNDPPSLVPELDPKLLNRSTHVLQSRDEKGHQLAWSQSIPSPWGDVTAEIVHAQASGREETLGMFGTRREYELRYARIASDPARDLRVNVYAADGLDEFEIVPVDFQRTVGLSAETTVTSDVSVELDLSHQVEDLLFTRVQGMQLVQVVERVDNFAAALIATLPGALTVGLDYERSNDPDEADDVQTTEVETDTREWLAMVVRRSIGWRHDVTLFAGSRRGGTNCVSGTCYVVPDFKGVEVRVTSRF